MPKRTTVYIDGFNLYYGALKGTPYKWLNIQTLWDRVLSSVYQVAAVKYFTAKVADSPQNPGIAQRQQTYLDAVAENCPRVEAFKGDYSRKRKRMEHASPPPDTVEVWCNKEKGSDVNLAVHMLNDAWKDACDVAVVVSNDADLLTAVELTAARGKEVVLIVPGHNHKKTPKRRPLSELKGAAHHTRMLRDSALGQSQLPNPIQKKGGGIISKPVGW